MTVWRLLSLFLLLLLSGGPGLWLTRKLRGSPPERLVAAVAASGITLYLTSAAIYVLRLPRFSYFLVSVACLGFAAAGRAHGRLLWASREVRWMLAGFAGLFFWALLLLALVRSYSGGMWSGDWIEHYQRTQFFLEHLPAGTLFVNVYPLAARPPFLNLIGAHFLAQAGERYDVLQVVFLFCNLLAFFPCWLLGRLLAPRAGGRAGRIALCCLLAASPFFLENATYLWTKGLANFYVLAGLWFYVRAWQKSDPVRLAAAVLALAAGILAHYSAAPFALLLFLHFAGFVLPRCSAKIRGRFLASLLPGAGLLATWITGSWAAYGAAATFGSNTTAQAAGGTAAGATLRKIGLNLYYSVVPHPLRLSYADFSNAVFQPNPLGQIRDYFFLIYQTNLIFGLGCVGGLAVLYLLGRAARGPANPGRGGRGFWFGLVILGMVLTVATHPTIDVYGVAHVCSQPLLLLGLAFLAARFPSLPAVLRLAVVAGCCVDFVLGIFLHFSLQAETALIITRSGQQLIQLTTGLLNPTAALNSITQERIGFAFLGDACAGVGPAVQLAVLALFGGLLLALVGLTPALRSPGRWLGPAARGLLPVSLALAAACAIRIRAQTQEILPSPPDLAGCVAVAQRDFDSSSARYNLGLALYRSGRIRAALDQWTEAGLLAPRQTEPRYFAEVIAAAYLLPTTPELEAIRRVRKYPASAEAHLALAARLWTHHHLEPARAEAAEALRLQPGYPAAQAALRAMAPAGPRT